MSSPEAPVASTEVKEGDATAKCKADPLKLVGLLICLFPASLEGLLKALSVFVQRGEPSRFCRLRWCHSFWSLNLQCQSLLISSKLISPESTNLRQCTLLRRQRRNELSAA